MVKMNYEVESYVEHMDKFAFYLWRLFNSYNTLFGNILITCGGCYKDIVYVHEHARRAFMAIIGSMYIRQSLTYVRLIRYINLNKQIFHTGCIT